MKEVPSVDNRNEAMLERMPELFDKLAGGCPRTPWCPSRGKWQLDDIPKQGVYVYYENGEPLYVGCSDHVANRIKSHGVGGKSSGSATFAFILTRDLWGIWKGPCWDGPFPKKKEEREKVRLIKKGTSTKRVRLNRKRLLDDGDILEDFKSQVERVKGMQVQVIPTDDPYTQAMFEVYAAYKLDTYYNDFRPH